jgi:hypothetical protein
MALRSPNKISKNLKKGTATGTTLFVVTLVVKFICRRAGIEDELLEINPESMTMIAAAVAAGYAAFINWFKHRKG